MRKLKSLECLFFVFVISVSVSYGQSDAVAQKWYQTYNNQTCNASEVIKLIDLIKFKPYRRKDVDDKLVKTVFLQYSPQIYVQLNDESNYLCSVKHDDYFELWNMYYSKVDKAFWDKNCKGLIMLMRFDGTAKVD